VEISKDDLLISDPAMEKTVKPGHQFSMEVVLKNPGVEGEYVFILSMATLSNMPFGDPFEFILHVKGGNKFFAPIKNTWNNWRNNYNQRRSYVKPNQGWKKKKAYKNRGIFNRFRAGVQQQNSNCFKNCEE
jgi:hypothetical protein